MEGKVIFLSRITLKNFVVSETKICCWFIKISVSGWTTRMRHKCSQCVWSVEKTKPFLLVQVIMRFIASCISFPWQKMLRSSTYTFSWTVLGRQLIQDAIVLEREELNAQDAALRCTLFLKIKIWQSRPVRTWKRHTFKKFLIKIGRFSQKSKFKRSFKIP